MAEDYSVRAVHCDHKASDEQVYQDLVRATAPLSRSWEKLEKASRIAIKFNMEHQKEMLYENTIMSMNVLKECDHSLIENVVYFGSSCMYPKDANQPMREFQIGTGELEKSNRGYALAKLAATEFATQLGYMTIVPCNLYGPNDDFSDSGHVIGSLIAKFEAPGDTVKVWGTGQAIREFLHVDDCADAAVFLAQHRAAAGPINVGSGEGASIDTLARLINLITDRNKEIVFDTTKPDGMMRKVMCVDKLKGWSPKINLIAGIQRLVKEYRDGK